MCRNFRPRWWTTALYGHLPSATNLRRLCFYTCLSVHGGGGLPQYMLGYHHPSPPGADTANLPPRSRHRHPPGSRHPPPSRRLLLRTVCILLECILVMCNFELIQKKISYSAVTFKAILDNYLPNIAKYS